MTRYGIALTVLLASAVAVAAADKPTEGKIRVYTFTRTLDESGAEKANAEDLRESVEDIQKRIKKMKWIENADSEEDAEMVFEVLDRRDDEDEGYLLSYELTAGEFHTKDHYGAMGILRHAGGDLPRYDQRGGEQAIVTSSGFSRKHEEKYWSWKAIADGMARTLNHFAQSNYERLIAVRESR